MPAVTAFVGSFFVDEIGEVVERTYYPAEPPGRPLPLTTAMLEGIKTALVATMVYLCALPWLHHVLGVSWATTLQDGLYPFVPGDIFKVYLAALALPGAWKLVKRLKG